MPNSARELLDAAYSRLGFEEGDLLDATAEPNDTTSDVWVNKGDWLALAKKVGAEKVFFVNDYPVIVFAEQATSNSADWMGLFNSVWCMARPQMLFLARDGELSVLNLTKKPARQGETQSQHGRLLAAAKATADIQEKLHSYRREQVESGRLFEDERFGFDDRADRALVRDLGRVRKALLDDGLQPSYAHALIGRSIFIRYLEDRRILDEEYFRKVAKGDKETWPAILEKAATDPTNFGNQPIFYPYVLTNKAFTYSLFNKLADDFNGDMFPIDHEEEKAVRESHLRILRRFLMGRTEDSLFFFAYRFDIIPIELISSIYEKFYSFQKKERREVGSYYTPSALADFVLAETLTDDVLAKNPRVIDPACGSGIFLVEAFRRIVRFRVGNARRSLTSDELRAILRDQIAGMDISSEAIRVAAFSLYLAMLHYLEPPSIQKNKRLPCLTFATRKRTIPDQHFDILIASDAFTINNTVSNKRVRERFLSNCADVVVGNPPWGAPPSNLPEDLQSDGGLAWCTSRNLSVGDRERSQTFLHRTLDLLKPGGRAGLLVSTGVFFKRHQNTKLFRNQWLGSVTLRKVVNFAAVRDAFFQNGSAPGDGRQGAIAPFAAVVFDNSPAPPDHRFAYWSAKETAFVKRVQAVVLNWADVRAANQSQFERDDTLWKIYWWGGNRDYNLIQRLRLETSFREAIDPDCTRMRAGFIEANKATPSGWLMKFKEFPTKAFERYGKLPEDRFIEPPPRVERRREKSLYQGARLLIKRGIDQTKDEGGRIAARFETASFSFRDSINCVQLDCGETEAKILLAILWSSLVRYYLFLTSGTWGLWHDEVKQDVIYSIPVRFPADDALTAEITSIVDSLRELPPETTPPGLFPGERPSEGIAKHERDKQIRSLEMQLDSAIYKLFALTDAERERVREFCNLELDLFYRGMNSPAILPLDWPNRLPQLGRRTDLEILLARENELGQYLATLIDILEPHLYDQGGRLRWRIVKPSSASSMIAVIFETETSDEPLDDPSLSDNEQWGELLARLDSNSLMPTKSKRVYIDGLIRIVSDTEIAIIKRNERRLWTKSAARDDAEAAMVLAIQLSEQSQGVRM